MANKRMIASDIWRDDFVCTLDYFQRLLWIGMVVTCADDQGRIQDRAGFIASDVFPGEMLSHEVVEGALRSFEEMGKIVRYSAGKANLIQVVNWWNYQSPSWAAPSKYAPPAGWIDRVKVHTRDNKVQMINWDQPGGFADSQPTSERAVPTPVCTPVGTRVAEAIDEVKCEDEQEIKSEVEVVVPVADAPGDDGGLLNLFEDLSGMTAPRGLPKVMARWEEAIGELVRLGVTEQVLRQAVEEMTEKKFKILGPWSMRRPCEVILGQKKREQVPKGRKLDSEGQFAAFVNR
jgi:hypothetical protein